MVTGPKNYAVVEQREMQPKHATINKYGYNPDYESIEVHRQELMDREFLAQQRGQYHTDTKHRSTRPSNANSPDRIVVTNKNQKHQQFDSQQIYRDRKRPASQSRSPARGEKSWVEDKSPSRPHHRESASGYGQVVDKRRSSASGL